MKNQQQDNARLTYFSGWHIALHNYDVFETESINRLVNISNDTLLPQIASISEQSTHYFTIKPAE